MTILCDAPDSSLGIAIRISRYVDCQARAIGENGFQSLVGGPVAVYLLPGLVTIFIALIGFRMLAGQTPSMRDGVSWSLRLGLVLALVTSWPAFNTLVYRVAVDAPSELADIILPAAGLSADPMDDRVQVAYDTIRLGSAALTFGSNGATGSATSPPRGVLQSSDQLPSGELQRPESSPSPPVASLFLVSTIGILAALRVTIGFLLAVAPLAILGLLFDATLGLFAGWLRALAGAAIGLLGNTIVVAVDLILIGSETANLKLLDQETAASVDPQALITIVSLGAVMTVVITVASARMASAFSFRPMFQNEGSQYRERREGRSEPPNGDSLRRDRSAEGSDAPTRSRASKMADVLSTTVQRGQAAGMASESRSTQSSPLRVAVPADRLQADTEHGIVPLGVGGRRSFARRTRSAARRDGKA